MSCLEAIIRATFHVVSSGSKSSPSKLSISSSDQAKLSDIIGKCTAKEVNLYESMKNAQVYENGKRPPITYIDVFNHRLFTVGIFILHPNARIPLHDHPNMFGLIKVLCGELKITSYTKLKQVNSSNLIAYEESQILTTSSSTTILTPTERNYHQLEFVKSESDQHQYTAFLDILCPPYGSIGNRPECNYYSPTKCLERNMPVFSEGKALVELRNCPCPRDFYNDIAYYMGPNLTQVKDELI